ncbi:thymidine phosphorylase [Oscillospiraceae bacterium WX1]
MRFYDIIQKKRDRQALTDDELRYTVSGFSAGDVPDYQMAAFLMAVYFSGMDAREVTTLTLAMQQSGDSVDLSPFGSLTADKHSTGGVGDKTTLIALPIVASLGVVVAKMSGRGLGHTGGTVDKLEAIPGFQTTLTRDRFIQQVKEIGIAVVGQSGTLAPADKKMYALRDVTATVDSIPLIASSVMSKKLASGAQNIVLDVKFGSGAFMKTPETASQLAQTMVTIGQAAGRNMAALVTTMDVPLGGAIGNALEVLEAVRVLKGEGGALRDVSCALAAEMLSLCHGWPPAQSAAAVDDALQSGRALEKFRQWIAYQGGDTAFIDDPKALGEAPVQDVFIASQGGYITHLNAELFGKASSALGAGREKAGEGVDPLAGIVLNKSLGDFCAPGETFAVLHTSDKSRLAPARAYLDNAVSYGPDKPSPAPLIHSVIR